MGGSPINRIQRITAAAAIGAAAFAPATAAVASARPDPGQAPQTSSISKAQIEHEERLQMLDQRSDAVDGKSAGSTGADTAGFHGDRRAGCSRRCGNCCGGVAVVRRLNQEPSRA